MTNFENLSWLGKGQLADQWNEVGHVLWALTGQARKAAGMLTDWTDQERRDAFAEALTGLIGPLWADDQKAAEFCFDEASKALPLAPVRRLEVPRKIELTVREFSPGVVIPIRNNGGMK